MVSNQTLHLKMGKWQRSRPSRCEHAGNPAGCHPTLQVEKSDSESYCKDAYAKMQCAMGLISNSVSLFLVEAAEIWWLPAQCPHHITTSHLHFKLRKYLLLLVLWNAH